MPFGTRITEDGRVNFRLWAPGADKVELCLQTCTPELRLPMATEGDGWYVTTTSFASSEFYYQYLIDGEHYVPDPASRYQARDINGPCQIVDPESWQWQDGDWKGLPWENAIFYELHVGTFSEEGTFAGVKSRLNHLLDLGVTAIQLMSIAEFPGQHNWGYDGVLLFAPDSSYGTVDELKDLIDTAHAKGLMIFNDVVYSHFGPEGNYLHLYAQAFFTDRHLTPWGDAINFDASHNHWVRQFFIHNALFWLEEYHFDGLRLDAVHAIFDDSSPDILEELAEAVRQGPGQDRHVHLVLENDNNAAHYLKREASGRVSHFDAQWNDDIHHVLHLLLTGEDTGYYSDYNLQPLKHLGRCLTEGFAYQGEQSSYRKGSPRGEPCRDLPLTAFVGFLQNHDQVGNRALGERISSLCSTEALRAATAILLLAPSPPLLFMGQEWACSQPFTYFVDFPEELGDKVCEGRLREFAGFPAFSNPESRQKIPLPTAAETYRLAKLAWDELDHEPHRQWFEYHRELLRIRNRHIVPRLNGITGGLAHYRQLNDRALSVQWQLNDGTSLKLIANLGNEPAQIDFSSDGKLLFASNTIEQEDILRQGNINPWTAIFYIQEAGK